MTSRSIDLPATILPGSPNALRWLDAAITAAPGPLVLGQAWMLAALPHRAPLLGELAGAGQLAVGSDWVKLDPYAGPCLRAINAALAAAAAAAVPGVRPVTVPVAPADPAAHVARAGLCLESRTLLDRLADMPSVDAGPALLAALSPAGIGGAGDAGTEGQALALLVDAARSLGITREPTLAVPAGDPLPRRVRLLELDGDGFGVRWSRPRGLAYTAGELRETLDLCSLEVQGDEGGRGGFRPGLPPRPRVFEARHMRPLLHGHDTESAWLHLERELRLPVEPAAPRGRAACLDWQLTLRLWRQPRRLEILVRLCGALPGHRYRLWLPLPFHPRASELPVLGPDGAVTVLTGDGPRPPTPVLGALTLRGKGHAFCVRGDGLREVEIFPRRNDHVCAITLLRAARGEPVPASVVRHLTIGVTLA